MQGILELLRPESLLLQHSIGSKRRVLEALSAALADDMAMDAKALLDLLTARERLGSTALGGGCAIPHCRIPGGSRSAAAVLTLESGIDFDAPDGGPVDVFLALAVPAETGDVHLRYLKELATLLSDSGTVRLLRGSRAPAALLHALSRG